MLDTRASNRSAYGDEGDLRDSQILRKSVSRSTTIEGSERRSNSVLYIAAHDGEGTAKSLPLESTEVRVSSNVQLTTMENEGKETVVEDPPLDEEILQILGDDPNKNMLEGDNIHQALSGRWTDIIKQGLSAEIRKELMQKYPPPANFVFVKPPVVNPEIKRTMSDISLKKDKFQVLSQQQLGAGLSAIGCALTDLLKSGQEKTSLVTSLSDAGRLLADIFHGISTTRRTFITPNLNRVVKNMAEDLKMDSLLYGEDFPERMKAALAMEKQVKDISKPSLPNVPPSKYKSGFQPKGQPRVFVPPKQPTLNSRGPPRKNYTSYPQGGPKRPRYPQPNRRQQ